MFGFGEKKEKEYVPGTITKEWEKSPLRKFSKWVNGKNDTGIELRREGDEKTGKTEVEIATHNTKINREIALIERGKKLPSKDKGLGILKSELSAEQQTATKQDQIERLKRMRW